MGWLFEFLLYFCFIYLFFGFVNLSDNVLIKFLSFELILIVEYMFMWFYKKYVVMIWEICSFGMVNIIVYL